MPKKTEQQADSGKRFPTRLWILIGLALGAGFILSANSLWRSRETPYDHSFFEVHSAGSASSAHEFAPEVIRLVSPHSIIDVGCGTGEWLAEFQKLGISDTIGVDGDYVERSQLKIPASDFLGRDLRYPLSLDRGFDLAISVETGEHLPPERAQSFVADLTKLAPVVLFSAAIPFQHGTDHINEEWPDYWAAFFAQHSYVALDCLRAKFWNDNKIDWWYRQNVILYARRDYIAAHPELQAIAEQQPPTVQRLVHPERYLLDQEAPGLRRTLTDLPAAARNSFVRHARFF